MLKHGVPQSLLGGKSFNFVAGQYLLYPRSGFKELLQAIISGKSIAFVQIFPSTNSVKRRFDG